MSFNIQASVIENPTGQILKLPCRFFHARIDMPTNFSQASVKELERTKRNVFPVIAKEKGEDNYEVILNAHILEACKQAKLDFVLCILVDDDMESQLQLEISQVEISRVEIPQVETYKIAKVDLKTASTKEITEALESIKADQYGFNRINPLAVSQAIVDYRQKKDIVNLNFITTLKCGIGKTKLPTLARFLEVA
jgi:hypothetical protein